MEMYVEVFSVGEILVDVIPVEPGPYSDGKLLEVHLGVLLQMLQ